MSTFLGLVEEIPGISIDCFHEDNLNSSAFFLSHCHTDHMKGLNYNFFRLLRNEHYFLYCSHISKSFLQSTFLHLSPYFVNKHFIELPLDDSKIIDYVHNGTQRSITVSCISAGHCPGSVMFLFVFEGKRILYTGDFRINQEDFSKLRALHLNNIQNPIPLSIDKIYLDTTFLDLNYQTFPSRVESLKKLNTAVKDWIEEDPKNIVILEISALYGSEFIYIELSKFMNKKIHVKDKVYSIYSRMETLANCVTNVSEITPIHACMNKQDSLKNTLGLKCRPDVDQKNILTIVPSVKKWSGKDTECIIEWDKIRTQTKNVCYSTHASYNELEAFIQYFKPKAIHPCVCYEKQKNEMQRLLRKIMNQTENHNSPSKSNPVIFSKYKTFVGNDYKSKILSDDEDDI